MRPLRHGWQVLTNTEATLIKRHPYLYPSACLWPGLCCKKAGFSSPQFPWISSPLICIAFLPVLWRRKVLLCRWPLPSGHLLKQKLGGWARRGRGGGVVSCCVESAGLSLQKDCVLRLPPSSPSPLPPPSSPPPPLLLPLLTFLLPTRIQLISDRANLQGGKGRIGKSRTHVFQEPISCSGGPLTLSQS